ncbi:MAG: TIGR01620 family protein [Pseudomonadota bacterium]
MSEKNSSRKPRSFDVPDSTKQATKPDPAPAPPKTRTRRPSSAPASQTKVTIDEVDFFSAEADQEQSDQAFEAIDKETGKPGLSFWRAVTWAAGLLISLAFGLWLESFWRDAFARNDWLGWLVSALIGLLVIGLLGMALREWMAIRHIKQVSHMREKAAQAIEEGNSAKLRASAEALVAHFASDPKTAGGRAKLSELKGEVIDSEDLYALHERELLRNLDETATRKISAAAKRVSIVTAVSPRALVDIGYVLFENIRLIRTMAELYGGRAGGLGTLTLARKVVTHLAITGAISMSEGLLQQLLGQGLAARISTRLGEGVFNGVMTARIGIAAMEVCRPSPFYRLQKPKISDFIPRLMPAKEQGNDDQ